MDRFMTLGDSQSSEKSPVIDLTTYKGRFEKMSLKNSSNKNKTPVRRNIPIFLI